MSAIRLSDSCMNFFSRSSKSSFPEFLCVSGAAVYAGLSRLAGAVLAGVVEPASAVPVVVEDDVLIGANAVVLEGVRVGKGAVVADVQAAVSMTSRLDSAITRLLSASARRRMTSLSFVTSVICM